MKHIFWEFFLPLHQTELLRPAANHCTLPVVVHLWVNWSASAGYRGNYNLAMTCVWLYCLTLWHTWWNIGDLKLKAHSGNRSVFPLGALLLTKQSLAEMNQDHHREEKKIALIFIFFSECLLCWNTDSMHPKTQSMFSFTASAPLWVIEKVAKREEQFYNIAV